jgi:hypothetical protein
MHSHDEQGASIREYKRDQDVALRNNHLGKHNFRPAMSTHRVPNKHLGRGLQDVRIPVQQGVLQHNNQQRMM